MPITPKRGSFLHADSQSIAIIALILVMLVLYWRQIGGVATRAAASVTIAVWALFAIEMISLHALDAVFYRPIGSVLTIGWLWAIAAAAISLAASRQW